MPTAAIVFLFLYCFTNGLSFSRVHHSKYYNRANSFNYLPCSVINDIGSTTCDSSDTNYALNAVELLSQVDFSYPSGLLITEQNNVSYCLLQHNAVKLRPLYKRVSELKNALSTSTCELIINEAEIYASNNGGWTADRHTAYPTTDLPLEAIFGKFSNIHGLVNGNILPEIASFFGLNEDYLSIGELFVAKYEYGVNKQAGLGAHVDGTPWSFVTSLNDPKIEFTGGGTRFLDSGITYRPTEIGTAVIFSGKNKHEGSRITSGVRYILTGFCNYAEKDTSTEAFKSSYKIEFDGSAAGGTRSVWEDKKIIERNTEINFQNIKENNDRNIEISEVEKVENIMGGIRIGDILRAVWVDDDDDSGSGSKEPNSNSDRRGRFVMLDGLSSDEIKKLLASTRNHILPGISGSQTSKPGDQTPGDRAPSPSRGCRVLVESDNSEEDDNVDNEEQRNIPRIASRLLSTGNYWSYDEILSGIEN